MKPSILSHAWQIKDLLSKIKRYLFAVEILLALLIIIILLIMDVIIAEKVVLSRLKRVADNKHIPGRDIIFSSLRRIPFTWFVLAGFFGAILSYSLKQDVNTALQKIVIAIFLFTVTLVLARLAAGFVSLFMQRTEGVSTSLIANIVKTLVFVLQEARWSCLSDIYPLLRTSTLPCLCQSQGFSSP